MFYEQDGKYVTEEYINLYKYYLREAYQICVISLYHSDYRIFKRFLQDYVFTIQLLKYNYKYNEIIKTQNFYLLVIGTYIANRLQEGMLSKKFMKLIVPLIKELEYVRISYDSFIYDEPLSLTGMQTRFKDFHYYCVLLFLYALSQLKTGNEKTEFINELIHKIERTENEPFVFETILRILSEKRDFELFNGDDISLLEKACETKVEKKEKNEFAELQKAVNSMPKEVLEYIVKQDIEKFEEHFNYCGLNNNDSNNMKKERLIVDEVNANNQEIEMYLDTDFKNRKKACDEINNKFGLNITVEKVKYDWAKEIEAILPNIKEDNNNEI